MHFLGPFVLQCQSIQSISIDRSPPMKLTSMRLFEIDAGRFQLSAQSENHIRQLTGELTVLHHRIDRVHELKLLFWKIHFLTVKLKKIKNNKTEIEDDKCQDGI